MTRLIIPVTAKVLWSTGDIRLWVDINLHLRDGAGNWRQRTFRVDTASDLTTMAAYEARRLGLPMPQARASGAVHRQTGLEVRSGYLRFQIAGLDQTEYAIPCLFLGDPNTPPAQRPPAFHANLLQPLSLLEKLRFIFENDAAIGAPYGALTVEQT